MCGIAGGYQLGRERLAAMLRSLHHRGPDGEGSHFGKSFAMGMTRLSILDIEKGQQPFVSPDQRIHAICNGEIYNWRELREELEKKGHRFETRCDVEILPAAWLEWGESLPEKLNGMFALAIHDAESDSLFLARDRCGQKPLYYTDASPFIFASEVKALEAAGVSLVPDQRQLATWLRLRYLPEPDTLFESIRTLPAGHCLMVRADGKRDIRRYWKPGRPEKPRQVGSLDELDRLTRDSVGLVLQSDVPLAAYLSAGVDSSLLAHYIKNLGAEVTTVSIGFGAGSDESEEAESFASSLGLPHESARLTPDSLADLPRVIYQMDRPVGDALILAFDRLASHTSSLGCKVALGGEGPDEHFAGYSFQKAYLQAHRLGSAGRKLASLFLKNAPAVLIDRIAQFPAEIGAEGRKKVADYLNQFDELSPLERTQSLQTLFRGDEVEELLVSPDNQTAQQEIPEPSPEERLTSMLARQYSSWLPDWSLIRQDKNCMAHSLEYRSPFLDHRLIDFAFSLPDSAKIHRGQDKYLWRQLAARHLPKSITHRPKQPFYLPLEHPSWRKPLVEMARDLLTRESLGKYGTLNFEAVEPLFEAHEFLPLKKLAALVILQLWMDRVTA